MPNYQMFAIPAPSSTSDTFAGSVGTGFVAATQITVTKIGVYDSGQGGLSGTVQAAIWADPAGTVVVGPISIAGTDGTLVGAYRYVDITPVVLPAGAYVIGVYAATEPYPRSILPIEQSGLGSVAYPSAGRYNASPNTFPNGTDSEDNFYRPASCYFDANSPPATQTPTGVQNWNTDQGWDIDTLFVPATERSWFNNTPVASGWPAWAYFRAVPGAAGGGLDDYAFVGRTANTAVNADGVLYPPDYFHTDKIVVFGMDSYGFLPSGYGRIPMAAYSVLGNTYRYTNRSHSGETTPQLRARYAAELSPWITGAILGGYLRILAILFEITNHLYFGATAAQALAAILAYGQDAQADGAKVLICTCLDRTDPGTPVDFAANNAIVRAGLLAIFNVPTSNPYIWATTNPTYAGIYLLDVYAIPGLTTYDGIHLDVLSSSVLGVEMGNAAAIIYPSPTPPEDEMPLLQNLTPVTPSDTTDLSMVVPYADQGGLYVARGGPLYVVTEAGDTVLFQANDNAVMPLKVGKVLAATSAVVYLGKVSTT